MVWEIEASNDLLPYLPVKTFLVVIVLVSDFRSVGGNSEATFGRWNLFWSPVGEEDWLC